MAKKIDKEPERAALVNFRRFAPDILKTIKKHGAAKFTPEECVSMRFVGAYLARDAVRRAGTGRKPKPGKPARLSREPEDFGLFARLAEKSVTHQFSKQNARCFERGLEIVKRNLKSLANRQAAAASARRKLEKIMKTDESRRAEILASRIKSAKAAVGKRDEDTIDRAAGGFARRDALTAERRSEIASQAAKARWARTRAGQDGPARPKRR